MKDPVSGVFRVSDWYDAHPHSSPPGTTLTGVIVADGLSPTPAEARADHKGKWVGHNELPVTVDRADPGNFRIEWDQVVVNDPRSMARQRASEAASRLAAGDSSGTPVSFVSGSGQVGGDLSSLMQQALRSAGMDPNILNGPNTSVHVETSYGTATPGQAHDMMAGFFGNQAAAGSATRFTVGSGTSATGVVRAVHDVASAMPLPAGMSQADLTLDVMRSDGSTYAATTRIGFRSPERRAAIATVGTRLPLLVDPNDPGRITVDVARLNLP
jgi:hypothetical protein